MTKNRFPVKTAIVSLSGDHRYLVNGKLYIIEIDESKTDKEKQKGLDSSVFIFC
jgi:hypothetical protein